MATRIKTLKDANGDILLPRTSSLSVMLADGTTNLQTKMNETIFAVDEIPATPIPRDADRLQGYEASYFADKASAQMFKLTTDVGLPKSIIANMNGAMSTGVYRVEPSTLNRPDNVYYGILSVTARTSVDIFQEVYSVQGYGFSRVTLDGGVNWSTWKPHAYLENGIIESGSNANGSYVKYGDGTMLCSHRVWRDTNVSGTIDASLSFPVVFVDSPVVIGQLQDTGHQSWTGNLQVGGTATNSVRIIVVGATATIGYYVTYFAMGRWK